MIPFVFLFAREWLLTYKSYENRVSWTYNKALRSVQSFCFRGFVSYCFRWMEGVIGDGKGKGRGWNETREGDGKGRGEGGMRQGKEWKGTGGGDGEESMNYPYIISSLFVPVWVVSG